ncbi:MAG: phosphodiester glycosidase family protein [Acidimicrobiales bacterium]
MDGISPSSSRSTRQTAPASARRAGGGAHLRSTVKAVGGSRRAERRRLRSGRHYWYGRHPIASGALVVILCLTPVWVSMGNAMSDPSLGVSVSARFAEWFRDHGGAPMVNSVENFWYSHHQPAVGGEPASGTIPAPSNDASPKDANAVHVSGQTLHPLPTPAALKPLASPPIAGEGQWHAAGRSVGGVSAVYEAFLRPDPIHTSLVVGVAWMDMHLLSASLYSGSYIPGGGPYKNTAPITSSAARSLVAAFNAGFRMDAANGGYYTQGRVIDPLRSGAASLVVYKNGTVGLGAWDQGLYMAPNVASVRQNLDLLVNHGRPVPGLDANDTTKWGATLGNQVYVWRSGLGITANGALVYVGGPGLNITTLADLLVRAGAVRAMELDINTDWVDYATFTPSSPAGLATPGNGHNLLSDMAGTPSRYFASWWSRDFFTVSAR